MKEYIHRNMPLTTGVARALIRDLFTGKGYVKRAEIIERICEYHTKNGGTATLKTQCVSAVRKTLSDIQAEKHPDTGGYWKID
ncbi:MAG: hypothetical protein OXI63_02280 [Candidatus Poribacteria bacterium]|nr:hypothetical protein [Candidatus Poribacteria bacterium]